VDVTLITDQMILKEKKKKKKEKKPYKTQLRKKRNAPIFGF
jgi:hypothetical protein